MSQKTIKHTKHILLIEPDVLLAKAYVAALQGAGFSVRAVADAQSAINAADMRIPDLVILEVQLASHNGIEFLHEFRSYTEWQDIPVIIFTMIDPRVLLRSPTITHDLRVSNCYYKPTTSLAKLVTIVREAVAQSVTA